DRGTLGQGRRLCHPRAGARTDRGRGGRPRRGGGSAAARIGWPSPGFRGEDPRMRKRYLARTGGKFRLKDYSPSDSGNYATDEKGIAKAEQDTQALLAQLDSLQGMLYASKSRALLIILQALDTGGKDGTIKHVMSGVNPTGCLVTSFKV